METVFGGLGGDPESVMRRKREQLKERTSVMKERIGKNKTEEEIYG